jgi:ABC-type nitrate/sulfonate/bicarbonate transport system permease component
MDEHRRGRDDRRHGRSRLIFAGILIIALLGLGLDACLRRLQRHLDPTMKP